MATARVFTGLPGRFLAKFIFHHPGARTRHFSESLTRPRALVVGHFRASSLGWKSFAPWVYQRGAIRSMSGGSVGEAQSTRRDPGGGLWVLL